VACIDNIWHATHHLPHYFIGEEREIKAIAEEARNHISCIQQPDRQRFLQNELAELEQLLDDWIAFKQESGSDFDTWCKNKGRTYSWVKAYYYNP
jgi:hypothetical protein